MDRYRKLKVIGKGSFGYAVQVQSVADRHTYVMKVSQRAERDSLCAVKVYARLLIISFVP